MTRGFALPGDCSGPLPPSNPLACPTQTNSGYIPWVAFKTILTLAFPLHRVCTAALIDDSGWMVPAAGAAYYDIISLGRATWEDQEDTAGRGFAQGCGRPDRADEEVQGDVDHDGDHDSADDDRVRDQHERWGR